MRLVLLSIAVALSGCATTGQSPSNGGSRYLMMFAGDADDKQQDFFAVYDLAPAGGGGPALVTTLPTGEAASMPHHMEYVLPPRGEPLFVNAHHTETTFLIDVDDPRRPSISRRIKPPAPLRFAHDFWRLPNGNRLAGFLRSEGPSPKTGDDDMPGNHGGIAEYDVTGNLIRNASAGLKGYADPIRPYAFAPRLDIDRVVTTSAPMMEDESADVVQVWRYSDLELLHTLPLPVPTDDNGTPQPLAAKMPFVARVMADGSVLLNSYSCALYRLTDIGSDKPKVTAVRLIEAPDPPKDHTRGACGVPSVSGRWWVMTVGRTHRVVTYDIADPANPKEVARLQFPDNFNPHWSAKDPYSDRLVIGAELGGESGMYLVKLDPQTGGLAFDESFKSADGRKGYIDLNRSSWPHGANGAAWAHAALFLDRRR